MAMTKKNGPEFPKQTALERFRKEIGKHFVRGTVDDGNALGLETVLHEEITNVRCGETSARRMLEHSSQIG